MLNNKTYTTRVNNTQHQGVLGEETGTVEGEERVHLINHTPYKYNQTCKPNCCRTSVPNMKTRRDVDLRAT